MVLAVYLQQSETENQGLSLSRKGFKENLVFKDSNLR